MTQQVQESFWGALASAELTTRSKKLTGGHYKLELGDCILKPTREKGLAFIFEMVVLESDNPDFPPGSKTSFFQLMQYTDVAQREIKRFICSVLGLDMSNPEHKTWVQNAIDAQPDVFMQGVLGGSLKGQTVSAIAKPEWTKPKPDRGKASIHVTNVEYIHWVRPQGWQPEPTPAVAAVPQHAGPCPYTAPLVPAGYPQPGVMSPQAAFMHPTHAAPQMPMLQQQLPMPPQAAPAGAIPAAANGPYTPQQPQIPGMPAPAAPAAPAPPAYAQPAALPPGVGLTEHGHPRPVQDIPVAPAAPALPPGYPAPPGYPQT